MGDYHFRGCGAAGQPFSFALFCAALLFALATACLTPAAVWAAEAESGGKQ